MLFRSASCGFDLFDFGGVLGEDLGVGSGWVQASGDLPMFVPDTEGLEEGRDFSRVGDISIFGGDMNGGHSECLGVSGLESVKRCLKWYSKTGEGPN